MRGKLANLWAGAPNKKQWQDEDDAVSVAPSSIAQRVGAHAWAVPVPTPLSSITMLGLPLGSRKRDET